MKRFYIKVRENEAGCLVWTAHRNAGGYGRFRFNGETVLAHRMAWLLERGEVPEGLDVLHTCDNPACVNTEHLFLGTAADNMADMLAKGRGADNRGEANANAKFTWEQVAHIRGCDTPTQALADLYGVTYQAVWRVRRGLNWIT